MAEVNKIGYLSTMLQSNNYVSRFAFRHGRKLEQSLPRRRVI